MLRIFIDKETNKEYSTWNLYEFIFQDMVECYIADMNYSKEEDNEEKITLTENEIKEIAHKMVYKCEPLWEYINETIDYLVGRILSERDENNGK